MKRVNRFLMTVTRNKFVESTKQIPRNPNPRKHLKLLDKRPIITSQRKSNADHIEAALQMGLGWRIVGATVLHRYPVITPDPTPWEVEMLELQEKIGLAQREFFMDKVGGTPSQMICDTNPTYEEIIKTMPFQPAPRVSEADLTNDRRSMERKLQESMYLVVKRNRTDFGWQFPQGKLLDSESSMRTVAERVIDRAVGKTRRWFISNAPIGHYRYAYPPAMQAERKQYGALVYFYRCQLIEGGVSLETRLYKDFAWVSSSELGEYLDKDFAEYMTHVLPR